MLLAVISEVKKISSVNNWLFTQHKMTTVVLAPALREHCKVVVNITGILASAKKERRQKL